MLIFLGRYSDICRVQLLCPPELTAQATKRQQRHRAIALPIGDSSICPLPVNQQGVVLLHTRHALSKVSSPRC